MIKAIYENTMINWKLVRRGQTSRFREIDLGNVDPLGEGNGADSRIAGLGLQVGDRLKYVYYFGDWIEHPPPLHLAYQKLLIASEDSAEYL